MRITRESIKKILIFFATYNEVDNIENLLKCTFEHLPGQEVLVVDDDSPDGTGDKLDIISQNNKHVTVIHRPRKLGLGTAHILAMQYAIKNKFDILITMDADFSHHPEYLPTLVDLMNDNDIGDTLLTGGGIIPQEDMDELEAYGVGKLFGPGTAVNKTINYINGWYQENREGGNE